MLQTPLKTSFLFFSPPNPNDKTNEIRDAKLSVIEEIQTEKENREKEAVWMRAFVSHQSECLLLVLFIYLTVLTTERHYYQYLLTTGIID